MKLFFSDIFCSAHAVCGYPPLPVNGIAALSNTTRGVEVEYSCFTGRAAKRAQSAICLGSGSWSAPPPTCPCELECDSHIFSPDYTIGLYVRSVSAYICFIYVHVYIIECISNFTYRMDLTFCGTKLSRDFAV